MRARKAASCIDCLAWGPLGSRRCMSCWVWRNKHPGESACAGCGRTLAVKDGYCRLCWQQARYQSRLAGGLPRGAVSVLEDGGCLPWHQLFFDRMQLRRPEGPVHQHGCRGAPVKPPPAPAVRPGSRWIQPRLSDARRDFTRFGEDADADLGNPWLAWGLYLAWQRGEARGCWSASSTASPLASATTPGMAPGPARRRPPQQAPRPRHRCEPRELRPAGAAGLVVPVLPPA